MGLTDDQWEPLMTLRNINEDDNDRNTISLSRAIF